MSGKFKFPLNTMDATARKFRDLQEQINIMRTNGNRQAASLSTLSNTLSTTVNALQVSTMSYTASLHGVTECDGETLICTDDDFKTAYGIDYADNAIFNAYGQSESLEIRCFHRDSGFYISASGNVVWSITPLKG